MDNQQSKQLDTPKPRMVRATVAQGRTVAIPHPTAKKAVGTTPEGKGIYMAELMHFGPGQEVELPADEVARLRSTGHLFDPDRKVFPLATERPARNAA
jgi:hypothetical protein